MAVQYTTYNTDGTTRTFPSTKHIATIQHVGVYLKRVVDNVWVVVNVNDYALVQNSIIFDTAPDSVLYAQVEVRVADDATEITTSPSDIALVAGSIVNVDTVATNIGAVNTVATNIGAVTTTSGSIANVNTVAANIVNVNLTAGNTANINAVVANAANVTAVGLDLLEPISEINTVATNISNVNAVGLAITNVNTVGTAIANVNTVATDIANVNTVAGVSGNVTTVAGISTKVTTVANNNTNINTVAGISSNVTTVAGISSAVSTVSTNNTNVSTVATNITNINSVATTVVPNIAEILLADNNAATATAKAAAASVSAASALASELAATAIVTAPLQMAIGNINSPLLDMPLKNSLAMKAGVGSATFTRASTATHIDRYSMLKTAAIDEPRFEKEGYLNEGASTNLLTYSEDFSNAIWAKESSTVTTNTTGTLDPYGTNLADAIFETAVTSTHALYYSNTMSFTAGVTYTQSVFLKPNGRSIFRISTWTSAVFLTPRSVVVNLTTKTISVNEGNVLNYKLEELANGWFRVQLSYTADATGTSYGAMVRPRLDDGFTENYLGDITKGFYVFGAQLEEALPFATSYIPTTTAAATRSSDILNVTRGGNLPNLEVNGELSILLDFDTMATSSYTNEQNVFGNVTSATDKYIVSIINSANNLNSYRQYYLNSVDTAPLVQNKTVLPNIKTRMVSTLNNTYEGLYLNGALANSRVRTGGRITQTQNSAIQTTRIGGYSAGSTTYGLFGHISNVRIFDKALTAQEVALA